jgi:hypothetical protein
MRLSTQFVSGVAMAKMTSPAVSFLVMWFGGAIQVYMDVYVSATFNSFSRREATTVFSRFLPETTALHLNAWQLDDPSTLVTLYVTSTIQSQGRLTRDHRRDAARQPPMGRSIGYDFLPQMTTSSGSPCPSPTRSPA